jgi:hypothetical protein
MIGDVLRSRVRQLPVLTAMGSFRCISADPK